MHERALTSESGYIGSTQALRVTSGAFVWTSDRIRRNLDLGGRGEDIAYPLTFIECLLRSSPGDTWRRTTVGGGSQAGGSTTGDSSPTYK